MPKETPVMRAPTRKEKVGDFIRDAYESVSEQPLARIADMLGMSDFAGMKKTFTSPDDGVRMGMMAGGPGKMLKSLTGVTHAPKAVGDFARRGGSAGATARSEQAANLGINPFDLNINQMKMKREIRPNRIPVNPTNELGRNLAPDVEMMHPAVPPEFHAVESTRKPYKPYSQDTTSALREIEQNNGMPQGWTESSNPANFKHRIDMNKMPSGKMEYLDPDVAEYMNPSRSDVTTREGQRRLRFLTGK